MSRQEENSDQEGIGIFVEYPILSRAQNHGKLLSVKGVGLRGFEHITLLCRFFSAMVPAVALFFLPVSNIILEYDLHVKRNNHKILCSYIIIYSTNTIYSDNHKNQFCFLTLAGNTTNGKKVGQHRGCPTFSKSTN